MGAPERGAAMYTSLSVYTYTYLLPVVDVLYIIYRYVWFRALIRCSSSSSSRSKVGVAVAVAIAIEVAVAVSIAARS